MGIEQIVEVCLLSIVLFFFLIFLIEWIKQEKCVKDGAGWIEKIKQSRSE